MASPYGAAAQQGILGLPNNNIGLLGASLKDAMAYFTGHPESATALLPAIQEAQQSGYMRSLLAPNQRLAPQQPIPNAAPAAQPPAAQPSPTNIQAMFDQKTAPTFDQMNAGVTNPNGAAPQPQPNAPLTPQQPPQPPQPAPVAMGMQPLPRMGQGQQPQPQSPIPTGADIPQAQKPNDYGDLNERAQAVYDQIPHIPGMPARQALTFYLTDPAAYQTAAVKQYEQTPEQKNAAFVNPGDEASQRRIVGAIQNKNATVIGRANGLLIGPDGVRDYTPPPAPAGFRYIQGADGQPYLVQTGGGMAAVSHSSYATNAGKAATTPDTGFDANGMPVATNNLAMTGAGNPFGLPGQPAATPQMLPHIRQPGPQGQGMPQGQQSPGPLMPVLPANQQPYMASGGATAGTRRAEIVSQAQGSQDRVNILDNIIDMADSAKPGPGSDYQNKLLGYAANAPILGNMMSGAKSDVERYQIFKKFLVQNAQQNWKIIGGTGTDQQQAVSIDAQPNSAQFPGAVKHLAQWVKAGELGVQAKANAQDRFLAQNGDTANSQSAFENQWRNSIDRRVFQLQAMPNKADRDAFYKTLTARDIATIAQKRAMLKQLGAIQ
jgi:hypothetical protein